MNRRKNKTFGMTTMKLTLMAIGMTVEGSAVFGQAQSAAADGGAKVALETPPAVALELKEGQYHVKTPLYNAIIAPSGLMSYLKVGSGPVVILERPLRLSVHPNKFDVKPEYICPTISQPEPTPVAPRGGSVSSPTTGTSPTATRMISATLKVFRSCG